MKHAALYCTPMRIGAYGAAWLVAAIYASASLAQSDTDADTAAQEVPPRYQVEVIVFAHEDFDPAEELLDASVLVETDLSAKPIPERKYFDALSQLELRKQVDAPIISADTSVQELPPFSDEILAIETFADDDASVVNFRVLERDELQLGEAYARIDRLEAYTPLVHGGWSQDSISEEAAIAFDLSRLGARGKLGSIQLHVMRFLHVTVDMQYRPMRTSYSPPVDIATDSGLRNEAFGFPQRELSEIALDPIYSLHAERRILRDEVNYIDHPAFGLVLLISLEPEPEEPTEVDADAARPAP